MKLRNKKTGEIINAVFEPCEGNLKVINKDEPSKWGEYSSLENLNGEWKDYEEPRKFWFIDDEGGVECGVIEFEENLNLMQQIGNYFETKEEAEKAVEKLKAWKRLKDKGFRFIPEASYVEPMKEICESMIFIACTMNDYRDFVFGDNTDIKLLFGGEE